MKKCLVCKKFKVKNSKHDLCYDCWIIKETEEFASFDEEKFEEILTTSKTPAVYMMLYGKNKYKIGYTNDLNSRLFEIKRKYPDNRLVYFREFTHETTARRFEVWLQERHDRDLNKFITAFQDKVKKVELV